MGFKYMQRHLSQPGTLAAQKGETLNKLCPQRAGIHGFITLQSEVKMLKRWPAIRQPALQRQQRHARCAEPSDRRKTLSEAPCLSEAVRLVTELWIDDGQLSRLAPRF